MAKRRISQKEKDRVAEVLSRLDTQYGTEYRCYLDHDNPWQLLVATILSAQCTDARVNIVCRELFSKFPTAESMAKGDILDIEAIVKPCGLYHMKAASIKEASAMLIERYNGVLPSTMDELLEFPGVGRKIANLLIGDVFGGDAVVTDTHCIRICGRLGMYPESLKDPYKVEKILTDIIAPGEGSDFCHRIVWFGRETCIARSPRCENCPLADLCEHNLKKQVH